MHGTSWRDTLIELRSGWSILIGAFLGVAIGHAALPFYTFGVFVGSLETAFGWTRSELSLAGLLGTLTTVSCAPMVGSLVDRYGVRAPAAVGLAGVAAMFAALSFMQGSFALYCGIVIIGAAIGLASTPLSFTRIVNEQFNAARGMALGLTLAGTGLTAALGPSLTAAFVVEHGWRAGYRMLALTVLVIAPLVLLLLGRRRSEAPGTLNSTPSLPTTRITLGEALKQPVFRLLLAAFTVLSVGVCGYVVHMIPMLTDGGMEITSAAAIQGSLGVAVIAGRVAVGALVDRFFAPRVAACVITITALGMVMLALAGPSVAAPAAFAIGFALGAEVDLIGYLTARYFGMASYGRLYGLLYGWFVLGAGVSPLLIAWLQERSGNYDGALVVSAALVALAAALFLMAPPFPLTGTQRPATVTTTQATARPG
jgi:MFS family permease